MEGREIKNYLHSIGRYCANAIRPCNMNVESTNKQGQISKKGMPLLGHSLIFLVSLWQNAVVLWASSGNEHPRCIIIEYKVCVQFVP